MTAILASYARQRVIRVLEIAGCRQFLIDADVGDTIYVRVSRSTAAAANDAAGAVVSALRDAKVGRVSRFLPKRSGDEFHARICVTLDAADGAWPTDAELDALAMAAGRLAGMPEEPALASLLRKLAPGHAALTERARIAAETERGEWPVQGGAR